MKRCCLLNSVVQSRKGVVGVTVTKHAVFENSLHY